MMKMVDFVQFKKLVGFGIFVVGLLHFIFS